jgi:hypothetical protein
MDMLVRFFIVVSWLLWLGRFNFIRKEKIDGIFGTFGLLFIGLMVLLGGFIIFMGMKW